MQHQTDRLSSSGLSLFTQAWLPDDGQGKAAVLIVHGIAEHSSRYKHAAAFLTARGFAVYGIDHRGHGGSSGERTYFESFDQPVADLRLYVDKLRARHPRLFLYGHSMGSLISLLYVLKYPDDVRGLVSSGTPLEVERAVPGFAIPIFGLLSRVAPRLPMIPVDSKTLSRDPAVVAAYDSDPQVDRRPGQIGMIYRLVLAAREVKARFGALRLPLLVLHGEDDGLTPPAGSHLLYHQAASADKTLRTYPGLRHEIHNEPGQQQVFTDIANWLDAHV